MMEISILEIRVYSSKWGLDLIEGSENLNVISALSTVIPAHNLVVHEVLSMGVTRF